MQRRRCLESSGRSGLLDLVEFEFLGWCGARICFWVLVELEFVKLVVGSFLFL